MKFFKFKTSMTWLATWFSVTTMVMTPVAQGQEAQNVSKQQMQSVFDQMGLNKQITVGEFFQKNKHLFPERILKEIEPALLNYKNVMMPEFRVTAATAPDGREIPNVAMTYNGQLLNMQWFGQKDKVVKLQNTNLSEVDLINFTGIFSKVLEGDEVLRKQNDAAKKEAVNAREFTSLPVFDAVTWKKMTLKERVTHMVQIRHLYLDAQNVLIEKSKLGKNKTKKTASIDFLEQMWAVLAGVEAEAQTSKPPLPTPPNKKAAVVPVGGLAKKGLAKNAAAASTSGGSTCLVAGYSVKYNSKGICDHTDMVNQYKDDSLVTLMNKECATTGQIACNPLVYGTPVGDGKPICITPGKSEDFQKATHFGGPCDSASRLQKTPSEIKILNNADKDNKVGRYDPNNLMSDAERRELFKKEQAPNYEETQKFIDGVLKAKNPTVKSFYVDGVLDEKYLEQVKEIQYLFDQEIEQSTKACRDSANDKKVKQEPNFYGACDQLHRRFLFIGELYSSKCDPKSVYNSKTFMCTCSGDESQAMPGAKCSPAVVAPTTPPAEPGKEVPGKEKPGKPSTQCEAGQEAKTTVGKISGAETTECVAVGGGKVKDDKKDCDWICSIGKGIKTWALPVLLVSAAAFLAYKLLSPKKPKLNAAADSCPNGTVAPCTGTCTNANQAWINGGCACPACPVGQTLTNASLCTCSTGTTTTTYTCWDGTTKVTDLTLCPTQTYTCWNGTKVTNPLNCPEQTTTTTTTTTTDATKTSTGR